MLEDLHFLMPMGFGARELLVSNLSLALALPTGPGEAPVPQAQAFLPRPQSFPFSAAEVRIDVTVLDRHGRAVPGLVLEDFEVWDGDRREEISSFLELDPAGLELEATHDMRGVHEPRVRGQSGVLFLLIDDYFLSPRQVATVAKAVEGFLANVEATATVWLWAPEAGIQQIGRAGHDGESLRSAVRAIRVSPDRLSFMRDPDTANPALLYELWWRRIEAIEQAFGLMQPKLRPARLVLISGGISYVQQDGRGRQAYDRLMDAAKRSETPLIWIDVSPLGTHGPLAHSERGAEWTPDARRARTPSSAAGYLRQAISARLRLARLSSGSLTDAVARDSGGYADRGELKAALSSLAALSRPNYLFGFVHSSGDDGRFHRLAVKVRRPGVTVHFRRGYWAASRADK